MSLLRAIRPLDWHNRPVKGGLDIPAGHDGCSHLPRSRRCRFVTGSTTSRTGRVGIAEFASHGALLGEYALPEIHQPIDKALAKAPFTSKVICRRPKPECVLDTNGRDS
jgi:hypothetical protein